MSDNMTKIRLICYYEGVLGVAQVWPDGDEPDDIDAKKVREVMNHCGDVGDIAREWDLPLTWHIEVTEEEEVRSWAQWRCNFLGGELEDKRSEVLALRKALQERDAQLAAAHEDLAEALAKIEALERQAEVAPNSINLRMNEGAVAIMNRALKAWGKQSQLVKLGEECGELGAVACRTSLGAELGREFWSEAADVQIMICQMAINESRGVELLDEMVQYKLNRVAAILDEQGGE